MDDAVCQFAAIHDKHNAAKLIITLIKFVSATIRYGFDALSHIF